MSKLCPACTSGLFPVNLMNSNWITERNRRHYPFFVWTITNTNAHGVTSSTDDMYMPGLFPNTYIFYSPFIPYGPKK